ncbi:hypothetical protein NDA18_001026 [Ustilago nuda]|nr:hypothetical protein NDA18_001026 [Ustilago nuda]
MSDGYRFLVDQVTVKASPTIKTMLSMGEGGGFAEAESNTARLQIRYATTRLPALFISEMTLLTLNTVDGSRGEVLEKVIEYLHFKTKYGAAADLDIPDFKNRIPPEIALELLMAADFLEL